MLEICSLAALRNYSRNLDCTSFKLIVSIANFYLGPLKETLTFILLERLSTVKSAEAELRKDHAAAEKVAFFIQSNKF